LKRPATIIAEHDPLLYEDAAGMTEYIAQALKPIYRGVTILLYAPTPGPHLQTMTEPADRVFCIYGEQARGRLKADAKMLGARKKLEAFRDRMA